MNKPPAFQFYAADFDTDTATLTNEEVGVYLRLLMSEWINGPLPNDHVKLARIARISKRKFELLFSSFETKFIQNGNGKLQNKRLEEERQKQEEWREKSRLGGIASGKSRARVLEPPLEPPHEPNGQPKANSSSSSSSSGKYIKKPEPYRLPSQEEITEASLPQVKILIGKICKELYERDVFQKSNAFANMALKKKANPRSVLHTLVRIFNANPSEPWGYAIQILKVEDQNFNERDYRKTAPKSIQSI